MGDLVALVTGGSGGIGAAICQAIARTGALVAIGYRGNVSAAADVVEACAGHAVPMRIDVTDEDSVRAAVTEAGELGRLGILVNNAGVVDDDLLLRLTPQRWDRLVEVNLRGAYLTSRAVLWPMLRARWGRIVNVSSIVGMRGNAGQAAYAATKSGLVGFTKSLAREVATKGITVNAVSPGFVETNMTAGLPDQARAALTGLTPIGRPVRADEVAHAVRFLVSEEAAAITGVDLAVDGGAAM
jgi:3-oxoacyl-[acyl-carrier protein] reductase